MSAGSDAGLQHITLIGCHSVQRKRDGVSWLQTIDTSSLVFTAVHLLTEETFTAEETANNYLLQSTL